MRKLLSILFIIPILAFSQHKENKTPLTPYTDVEFQDGFVVYSVNQNMVMQNPRLMPLVIDRNILRLKFGSELKNVSGAYMVKSQKAIRDYVNTEPIEQLSKKDKIDYLKLCALLVIWDNNLSSHAVKELEKLKRSSNNEIKESAELVYKLLVFYQESDKRK